MATEIFISYRNEDQQAADRLCEALEKKGLACWIAPRNIPPGREWPEAIVEGATNCRAMVVVLSSHSVASRQVGRELETADHAGARIIAFRIENVQPPPSLAFFLGNVQWVDAFDGRFDQAVEQLASAVKGVECPPVPLRQAAAPAAHQLAKKTPNYVLIGGGAALAVALVIGGTMIARSRTATNPAASTNSTATSGQSNAAPTGGGDAEQSWKKGKELVDANNANGAIPYLNRSIELDSARPNPYVYRAIAESSLNQPAQALADASKAIELEPSWAYAYLVRARIYVKAGKDDLAIPDFSFVVQHGVAGNVRAAKKELAQAQQRSGGR